MKVVIALCMLFVLGQSARAQGKLPIPDDEVQKQAVSLIGNLYKAEYDAAKTLEQKSLLARKMLQVGKDSKDEPTGRYVLFRLARDIAAGAGDAETAVAAIDDMAALYEVDALAMTAEVLARVVKALKHPSGHQTVAATLQSTIDDAVLQDRFDVAKSINTTALDSARQARSADLVKQVVAQGKELDEIEAEYQKVQAALERLQTVPTDPEANFLVGRYQCFIKGDWDDGLLMLAVGSDETLKKLAEAELAEKPDELSLGNGWWARSEECEGRSKQTIQSRASVWYRKVLPTATGLTKALLEQRLASVNPHEGLSTKPNTAPFSIEIRETLASIKYQGEPFADYHIKQGSKPFLWPVIGPNGHPFTRSYPMEHVPGEDTDHPPHRSIWFGHDDVNGVNFWTEVEGQSGRIEHRKFTRSEEGDEAILASLNDWLAPNGQKLCEDSRVLTFRAGDKWRSIDFDIEIKATSPAVVFNDTRQGGLAIRVASALTPSKSSHAQLVSSSGHRGDAAWGKRASWIDFNGSLAGEKVGIAVLDHPKNFRSPIFWHARNYGLLVASTFAIRDFTDAKNTSGLIVIPSGKSIKLRYRIILHLGDEREADLSRKAQEYFKQHP